MTQNGIVTLVCIIYMFVTLINYKTNSHHALKSFQRYQIEVFANIETV